MLMQIMRAQSRNCFVEYHFSCQSMSISLNTLRVNLLIHVHTAGLRHDLRIWERALSASGVTYTITAFHRQIHRRALRAVRKITSGLSSRSRYDINIFVEKIVESWCSLARVNVLVPHQEWVFEDTRARLPLMNEVFCKTRYAKELFEAIGAKARYIGFTSSDRFDPNVRKDYGRFLHVAGSSLLKGTGAVNEIWARHPEWPQLTLCAYEPSLRLVPAANISPINSYLQESSLLQLQNACGIHLCPSESEGFGHYIVEAMSTEALVVTTDAPPMNEIVRPDRGALVGYTDPYACGMGMNFPVDPAQLERTVDTILGKDVRSRRSLGETARAWFRENDRAFLARFRETLVSAV
jgi:glycosyltransferase involved in cell wall biosynthesis